MSVKLHPATQALAQRVQPVVESLGWRLECHPYEVRAVSPEDADARLAIYEVGSAVRFEADGWPKSRVAHVPAFTPLPSERPYTTVQLDGQPAEAVAAEVAAAVLGPYAELLKVYREHRDRFDRGWHKARAAALRLVNAAQSLGFEATRPLSTDPTPYVLVKPPGPSVQPYLEVRFHVWGGLVAEVRGESGRVLPALRELLRGLANGKGGQHAEC